MSQSDLQKLVHLIAKLPGLGPRSARRVTLHLLKYKESMMLPLAEALKNVAMNIKNCRICGNLDESDPCNICDDIKRDKGVICVVEEVADLWAIERSGNFNGLYHVLGGTLSAMDMRKSESLNIEKLVTRASLGEIYELIIATNATMEGETTAHYITERLKEFEIKITRLAYGLPVGGELDYLDDGTLTAAFKARQIF